MFIHEGYLEAATSRARCKLGSLPQGHRWSDYWLFVALEINKEIALDNSPRPAPFDAVMPVQYMIEDYPQRDCVTIAKVRKNWFRNGGPVGVIP